MQCTYVLSKIKPLEISRIKKLVVTNPYTNGLKSLMYAFNTSDIAEKSKHYKKALSHLEHIKYYYLEALYFYCKFLKEIGHESFQETYDAALAQCRTFKYQSLDYKFSNLNNNLPTAYRCDLDYYELEGLNLFLKEYNANWEKALKDNSLLD